MIEKDESKDNNNPDYGKGSSQDGAPQSGLISRLAGGVYEKTATVVGGATWVAGTAVTTTYGAIKGAGGYITFWKKREKDKSD